MGYRSFGAMWFSQEALDLMNVDMRKRIDEDIENDLFSHVHTDADTDNYGIIDGMILEFDMWKWYPSYKDIQTYESIFKMLAFLEVDYDFVRFGENFDDSEIRTHKMFMTTRGYEVRN
jgi:hypothetical protein